MEKEILYNENIHFEHESWKRELNFWKNELNFFINHLSELVTRWISNNIHAKLEHYQNEIVLNVSAIEDLEETIKQYEVSIAKQIVIGGDYEIDSQLVKKHLELRNSIEKQRHIYEELKKDFFIFLEKYI